MTYIDPHIHCSSRTTDDYEAMAAAGVVAVIEPAFWNGQPRTNVGSFIDYFASLVGWERFRAGQFGIRHYCCMGLNAKEANDEVLADEVLDLVPRFRDHPGPATAAQRDARAVAHALRHDAEAIFTEDMGMGLDQPLRNGLVPRGKGVRKGTRPDMVNAL